MVVDGQAEGCPGEVAQRQPQPAPQQHQQQQQQHGEQLAQQLAQQGKDDHCHQLTHTHRLGCWSVDVSAILYSMG